MPCLTRPAMGSTEGLAVRDWCGSLVFPLGCLWVWLWFSSGWVVLSGLSGLVLSSALVCVRVGWVLGDN